MKLKEIITKKKKIGLALGAGGARGLCHIAFLKVFDDLDCRPHIISGTSIGAFIGALYASGMSGREIEVYLTRMSVIQMTKLVDVTFKPGSGLVKGNKLIKYFSDLIDDKQFEELKIPLKIVATDFWNRSEVVFRKGSVVDAVRASISISGIMEPFISDNNVLIDGGAVNPLPYDIIQDECDIVVAIDVFGEKTPSGKPSEKPSVFENIFTTFQIMETSILESKMSKSKPDIYIKPKLTNFRVLEFHRSREILQSVKEDTEYLKNELIKHL